MVPVWTWLAPDLAARGDRKLISRERKALVLASKLDEALARAAAILDAGRRRHARRRWRARRVARRRRKILGDALAVEDMREMALLLSAGETIAQLVGLLPQPVPLFHEQMVWQVREIYDELIARTARCRALMSR